MVLATQSFAAAAKAPVKANKNYLTIGSVEISDVTNKYDDHRNINLQKLMAPNNMVVSSAAKKLSSQTKTINETLDVVDVIVDKIINIGTKVWTVIAKGQPVMGYKNTVASAVPENTKDWTELENYKDPQTKVLKVIYKNLYGAEVVHFTYRIILVAGGSSHGVGNYIGYAAVEPVEMTTGYLYNFDAQASVENVFNKGSSANPVAGMVLTVRWNVSTIVKKTAGSHTFFLDGQGNINMASMQ